MKETVADPSRGGTPGFIFWLQIVYIVALLGIAFAYFTHRSWIGLPDRLGPVSVAVPWFGALGAVLISISAAYDHRGKDWDPSFKYWHWSRPLVGACVGTVAVLIFQAGILAVGSQPQPSAGGTSDLAYYLMAFVVGYRELTFRELMKRVVDVILKPAEPTVGPVQTGLQAPEAPGLQNASAVTIAPAIGPAAGSTHVTISGVGVGAARGVRFGGTPAPFEVLSATELAVTVPAAKSPGAVPVTIATGNGAIAAGSYEYGN